MSSMSYQGYSQDTIDAHSIVALVVVGMFAAVLFDA